jgi:hypothetical protein
MTNLRSISLAPASLTPAKVTLGLNPTLCIACENGNHGEADGPVTVCTCPCHVVSTLSSMLPGPVESEDRHVARFKARRVKSLKSLDKTVDILKGDATVSTEVNYLDGKIYIEQGNKKEKKMSLQIIGRDTLPVSTRGKVGTCSVSVRENGQIGFSNSAGKVFENFTATLIGWDPNSRTMAFTPVNLDKLPKGVKKEQTFPVGLSEKIGTRYISAATLFKLDAINYDFKASGTHSFPATITDMANGGKSLTYNLPVEMEPKPKVAKGEKKGENGKAKGAKVGNGNGSTASEPALELA